MGVGRAAAVVLGLALSFGPGVRAEPGPVQDLAYGEGLFLYFKDDYFGAITRLLAAQTREELPHQADEAELLLGGVHLSYGQQDVANAIFEQMLDERVSPAVRDRAWFYLGKMAYQRGRPEQAQEAFARIGRDLPDDLAGERSLIAAQVLMQQDRFDGAVAALEDWKGPRDRYRVLRGLVRWQLEAGYSERMWAQRKALRALDAALAEAHDRRERLIALREEVPATFEGYAARIDALAPRIDALQARADGAVDAQGGALQMLALAEVAAQKKRLGAYLTEAQYALAAVYDRAAHAGEQP